MTEKANKVKFNLKNTHYALLTIGEDGTPTFGTPVPMPGSVSISLDANGEPENFYADGGVYYVINNNCGYDGDLELALIPESFRTDVLKETLDSKGVLIENSEVELAAFALLFEFDGDQKHIRHVLYNCKITSLIKHRRELEQMGVAALSFSQWDNYEQSELTRGHYLRGIE